MSAAVRTNDRPTVGSLLRRGESELAGGDSPRLDAEVLLGGARRCSRAALFRDRDEAPAAEVIELYLRWVAERARGVPVAYLVGRREFWSLDLGVTPEGPVKHSHEGYRRVLLRDLDGYRLCLFDRHVARTGE